MKKKILFLFVVAFAAGVTFTISSDSSNGSMDLLISSNVEALASGESGSGCSGGCSSIGWGTSKIAKCDCSYTGLLSSCERWGC